MPITETYTNGDRRVLRRLLSAACALTMLLSAGARASAQARERPVPLDGAGRIMAITPPLAARLSLTPPLWPVTGDYVEARLYALDDSAASPGSAVLVVRRQRDVLERYPFSDTQRRELSSAIERAMAVAPRGTIAEDMSTIVSEPVRGGYVLNQTVLGGALFGPAAAALTGNAALGSAVYLLFAGGTFFLSAERSKNGAVTRAQNHLAWHGARQGASAAYLATYALVGEAGDDKGFAAALLAGGIVGDIVGDRMARTMTDAEAHGVSHGGVFAPALLGGVLGTAGLAGDEGSRRVAAGLALGAQVLGYPLGMRYVRGPSYRVTAGDVGTLIVGEAIGLAAAGSFVADEANASDEVVAGALTAGFALGAILADRAFVSPFDYTDSESRLLQLGTLAGGVVALAVPVAATANDARPYLAAATVGGILGAVLTHRLLTPRRATAAAVRRTGVRPRPQRFDVTFTPQTLLMAGTGARGIYPVLNVDF
ncbi:MAG: hypothetical protein ABIP93_11905 [Gemmatimonadaceae bacterium]